MRARMLYQTELLALGMGRDRWWSQRLPLPRRRDSLLSLESLFSDAPPSRGGTSCVLHADIMTFFATA